MRNIYRDSMILHVQGCMDLTSNITDLTNNIPVVDVGTNFSPIVIFSDYKDFIEFESPEIIERCTPIGAWYYTSSDAQLSISNNTADLGRTVLQSIGNDKTIDLKIHIETERD